MMKVRNHRHNKSCTRIMKTLEMIKKNTGGLLRLSPTEDLLWSPNPKWISNTIPIASNEVTIWKTHFRCQERHNQNLSISLSRRPICRKCWPKICIELFTCSATQRTNVSYILGRGCRRQSYKGMQFVSTLLLVCLYCTSWWISQ